jgi:nucleoid-associated protein YgaU
LQLRCVLTRVGQKFTRFLDDGRPVRARLTVAFSEFIDEARESREVNRQTADFTKARVVAEGDTLSGIAGAVYADPRLWRPIAIANDIDDPRVLEPGRTLRIPALPFTDPQSGEVVR